MRRALRAILRLALRIFFRRVEIAGAERLPAEGPVVIVVNHPSALVDPMLLLAFLPRPAAFLAKEPIFRLPILGAMARALDSIPIYRAMDGADTRRNRETFERARALLAGGGVLALFPEGTSHDDPRMKPLKSGAARIALGTASSGPTLPLSIIPAGLVFTDKRTFRSEVLVAFGEAIPVEPGPLGECGEPAPAAVRALTARIEAGLAAVVLQAEEDEALALAAAAERLFTEGAATTLAERVALRRRLLAGRARLAERDPARLAQLERRLRMHLATLDLAGRRGEAALRPGAASALGRAALCLVLAPVALPGAVLHAPAWIAVDRLAHRFARGDASMAATVKILAGLILYPLTWAAAGLAAGLALSAGTGLLAAGAAAACGAAALAFFEGMEPAAALARAATLRLLAGRALSRLLEEQEALRAEILAAAALVEPVKDAGAR